MAGLVKDLIDSDMIKVLQDPVVESEVLSLKKRIGQYPFSDPYDKNVAIALVNLCELLWEAMSEHKKILDKHLSGN